MLSINEIARLARIESGPAVSLYIPTARREPDAAQNRIRFKNGVAEIERRAGEAGVDGAQLEACLAPVRPIADDHAFWDRQGDGLAYLATPDERRLIRLDHSTAEFCNVGDRLCVRPLLPAARTGRSFLVLALSQNEVRLVRCTRDEAIRLDATDIPKSLADALGYDYEERHLQFHTSRARPTDGPPIYHGQGSGGDAERERELDRFLHRVDVGLRAFLSGRAMPLVLAGDEHVVDRFKAVAKHDPIAEDFIRGNPEQFDDSELQETALPMVRPVLDANENAERARAEEAAAAGAAITDLGEIIAAGRAGRVKSLVLDPTEPVWGGVEHDGKAAPAPTGTAGGSDGSADLLNSAVVECLATGAAVLATDPGSLPSGHRAVANPRF